MTNNVLILGNPLLRTISKPVFDFSAAETATDIATLKNALEEFRAEHGFGRGIAGIQIGIKKRIVALNLGSGTFVMINPQIICSSEETFTLWDDCMSFPDLMVKVRRNSSVTVEFCDATGTPGIFETSTQSESELLQHELDHLDGTMATDRALTIQDIIYKTEFDKHHNYYRRQVDYEIIPTI